MTAVMDLVQAHGLAIGLVAILSGGLVLTHGLLGWPASRSGLLRSKAGTLNRTLGWRRVLSGLVLVGLGASLIWHSPLLLFLALGIGFVELWEASFVISVMQHDHHHQHRKSGLQ